MNVNLLFKSLKDIRISWPAYAAGLILYAYLITSIYPTLFRDSTEFLRLLESYPESILKIFGGGTANLATVEGFLALEMFALMWIIIAGAFVIAYATGVIAKEIESGTIEMLLSQPITRVSALVTKSIVLFAGTIGLVIVTLLATYLTGLAVDIELKPEGVVALGIVGSLFFLAIGSYSLLFSVIFGERGRAAFTSAGL
ncbi:MAG: ABC transporter permease subunit, partial [Actinobacteria bacterium]|nr:ABC transporter permease subunit [Actinomycetota bacterium]